MDSICPNSSNRLGKSCCISVLSTHRVVLHTFNVLDLIGGNPFFCRSFSLSLALLSLEYERDDFLFLSPERSFSLSTHTCEMDDEIIQDSFINELTHSHSFNHHPEGEKVQMSLSSPVPSSRITYQKAYSTFSHI